MTSISRALAVVAVAVLSMCSSAAAQGVPVITSVTADRAFPAPSTSAPVRWTANVSGSSDGLEFRFWHYSSRINQWQPMGGWSTNNTWVFHPSPLYEGRNVIQVWVRTGSAGDAQASRNSDDFELGPAAPADGWTPTFLATSLYAPSYTYFDLNNSEFSLWVVGRTIHVFVHHLWSHRMFQFNFTFPTDALVPGTYPYFSDTFNVFTVHSFERPGATPGSLAVDFGDTQLRIRARVPMRIGEVAVSHLNQIPAETHVRITADSTAGDVPLEYRFVRTAPDGTQSVQDYSYSRTMFWHLRPAPPGTHRVTVWIRRQGSPEVFEWVRQGPDIVIPSNPGPAEMVSLTADRSFPAPAGSTIRWTATARNGGAPHSFKFWHYSFATGKWTVVCDWSELNICAWQSAPFDVGPNLVQGWVRSSSNNVESFLSSGRFDLTAPNGAWMMLRRRGGTQPSRQVVLSSENSAFSSTVGSDSVFASFTNPPDPDLNPVFLPPNGSLLLQMPPGRVLAPGLSETEWGDLSPYFGRIEVTGLSRDPCPGGQGGRGAFRILEIDYTPEGVLRKLAADAHQPCLSGAYEYTESAAIRVNSTLPLFNFLSLTSNVGATVAPRTRVEWRAVASSGTGGVEYKFWLYRAATQTWTLLQDWSTDDTSDWTPASTDTGRFYVQTWARTIGSGENYEGWRQSDPLDVAPGPPRVHAIETDPEPRSGQGTTLRVTAGGGNADLEYRFWAYDRSTGAWTMLRDYAPEATFVWNTNPTQRGQYTIQVWARESGTTGEPQAWLAQDLDLLPARVVLFRGDSAAEHQTGGQLFSYTTQTAKFGWYGPEWETGVFHLFEFSVRSPDGWHVGLLDTQVPGRFDAPYRNVLRRGSSFSCPPPNTFILTLHESTRTAQGGLDRLAVDFEQTCDGAPAKLYGGIRWNSTIDTLALSAVKAAPQPATAGAAVTLTAIGSSSTEPVEFKFWLQDISTGTWTMVRDYAAAHTATWTPATAGSYLVQVWMRRQGQTAGYERWKNSAAIAVQ